MSNYKFDSGQDIVYVDHSTSGSVVSSISQSSADPTSLASLLCIGVFVNKPYHLMNRALGKEVSSDLNTLTPKESDLYLYNLQHREEEEEAEDALLIASNILPKILVRAMQKPPSDDWERYLDEL